jgi:16S rRNA (cytosine967-C5)-methyltransferase
VLCRVERDAAYADLALHALLREADLSRRDRAFATELAYGTLRLRGRIDAVLAQVLDRDLARLELGLRNLLRLGAYQILFLDGTRDAAAVSEAVSLARDAGFEEASRLVNAVLRQVTSRGRAVRFPSLDEDPVAHLTEAGSLPRWIAERWLDDLGPLEAAALAEASMRPPPRTVRACRGADPDALLRRLGGRRCAYAPRGLTALPADPVRDPGFERGEFVVQDEASQLVPLLLGAEEGDSVVDCCAAPGVKTVQLAEQVGPGGEVIALELHARRLGLIRRNVQRLGLGNVRGLERDVAKGFDLRGRQSFRRILVDAPCSGLGVLRRNPDARWRLEPEDLPRLAEQQGALLASAARYVEQPGGVLVYSVCSVDSEETSGVLRRFLETHPDFRVDDPGPVLPPAAGELVDAQGALRTFPHRHGCDAFFAVRLVRT